MLHRRKQAECRPAAIEAFTKAVTEQVAKVEGQDEKYAHLTTEEREKVRKIAGDAIAWLTEMGSAQEKAGKTELVVSIADIQQRSRTAVNEILPIVNRPKPKPEPEPEPEPEKEAEKADGDKATEEPAKKDEDAKKEEENTADSKADADAATADSAKKSDE